MLQISKHPNKIILDGTLPLEQQIENLMRKVNLFFQRQRYSECIEILNKVIEMDNKSVEAIKLRAFSHYHLEEFDNAEQDFKSLKTFEEFYGISTYYLGNLENRKFNREKAIEFWEIAKNNGVKEAQVQLDYYCNYTGKFILKTSDIAKKLGHFVSDNISFACYISKYLSGLSEIDGNIKKEKASTDIIGNSKGIQIEIKSSRKKFNIAISYYEIEDINLTEKELILQLYLFDSTILQFEIDDTNLTWLKKLINNYTDNTGKIPSIEI